MTSLITSLTRASAGVPAGHTSHDFVSAEGSGIFPTAAISTATIGAANQFYLTKRQIIGTETYDQVIVEATTGGTASKCRAGMFRCVNDRPAGLIVDSGDIDLSAIAVLPTALATPVTLTDCWVYDWTIYNNTLAVMRGTTGSFSSRMPKLTNAVTALIGSLFAAQAYGAAPATCPAVTQGDSRWFRVQWRIA